RDRLTPAGHGAAQWSHGRCDRGAERTHRRLTGCEGNATGSATSPRGTGFHRASMTNPTTPIARHTPEITTIAGWLPPVSASASSTVATAPGSEPIPVAIRYGRTRIEDSPQQK